MTAEHPIVAFLRARYDEAEKTARAAGEGCIAWLTYRDDEGRMLYTTTASAATDDVWITAGAEVPAPTSALVVYDPVRTLRDIEAKRRILDEYEAARDRSRRHPGDVATSADFLAMLRVVKLLAASFSDHPEYAALGI